MTTLLLIRHGQSVSNLENYFTGAMDIPLTELGQRQALVTARYILSTYQVDGVYASDLCRAFETGKAVADPLGISLTPDSELREIFAGKWEGMTFDRLAEQFPETYRVWRTNIGLSHPDGGESVAHLQERILNAVTRIAKENEGKTLVIATHATPIRVLQCHCEGKPLDRMHEIPWVSNASVTHVEYDGEQLILRSVGYDAHLEGMTSQLPPNV